MEYPSPCDRYKAGYGRGDDRSSDVLDGAVTGWVSNGPLRGFLRKGSEGAIAIMMVG